LPITEQGGPECESGATDGTNTARRVSSEVERDLISSRTKEALRAEGALESGWADRRDQARRNSISTGRR
jgi:hypothetical protein